MTQTFTAPKAYITIEGQPVGYARTINFTENISRQPVRGLGNLNPQEQPATAMDCTYSIDTFFIDFNLPYCKKLLNRYGGAEALKNTLSLGELPFSINIYSKQVQSIDSNTKLVTSIDKAGKEIATLKDCFINSQAFTLSEGGIAALNSSGGYLTPVSFSI